MEFYLSVCLAFIIFFVYLIAKMDRRYKRVKGSIDWNKVNDKLDRNVVRDLSDEKLRKELTNMKYYAILTTKHLYILEEAGYRNLL